MGESGRGMRARLAWGAAVGLAAGLLTVAAAAAPKQPTVADAQAAVAEGLHGKAGALYLEIYERTGDRALLPEAARELLATQTVGGRLKAGRAAQQYLATASSPEQEQEALALVALVEAPKAADEPGAATGVDAGPAPGQPVGPSAANPAGGGPGGAAQAQSVPTGQAPGPVAPPGGAPSAGGPGSPPGWMGPGPVGAAWQPSMPPSPAEIPPGFEGYVEPPPALAPGSTSNRVPFAQRGKIGVELSTGFAPERLRDHGGTDSVATATVIATIPIARASFFEARAPLSLVRAFGSPMFGFHHVAEVADGVWITGGGAMGFPMNTASEDIRRLAYPRALWDAHLYYGPMFPLQARFEVEYHVGLFGLRVQLEPALWLLVQNDGPVGGALPHALELQLGHEFGGGLRLQGVASSIPGGHEKGPIFEDAYQLALNPFFTIHRDQAALRVGAMLPLDEQLGPPFAQSFGLLLDVGVNLD